MNMTKEEFLRDPLSYSGDILSDDWIREGWSNPRFRDEVIYAMARSLSKTGGFHLVGKAWLLALPRILTPQEVADLYVRLRDDGQRLEFEWRQAFITLFPETSSNLPPSNDAAILLEDLEYIVSSGDGRSLETLLPLVMAIPDLLGQLPVLAEKARNNGHNLIESIIRQHVKGVGR